MRRGFILALLLLIPVFLSGQDVKVSAAFDSSRIFIGDQVNFTVTLEKPAGFLLSMPLLKDSLVSKVEILKGPASDTSVMKDGRVKIVQKYLVTSFDSGFYQVPPVYAELKSESGIKRFYSDYSPLTVMRVKLTPPDTTLNIFDIVKPYKAPITFGEVFPWLLAVIVLAVAAWYAVKFIKKLREKQGKQEAAVIITEPAHIIALRDLEKLKEEELWQKGEVKLYYSRLSEILRQYLENRYGVQSLELTTYETLALLRKTGFKDDELYAKLRTLLNGADLVKFAKYKPEKSENEQNFENGWDFVSLTRVNEVAETDKKSEEGEKK